jgi:hypothetical protein
MRQLEDGKRSSENEFMAVFADREQVAVIALTALHS